MARKNKEVSRCSPCLGLCIVGYCCILGSVTTLFVFSDVEPKLQQWLRVEEGRALANAPSDPELGKRCGPNGTRSRCTWHVTPSRTPGDRQCCCEEGPVRGGGLVCLPYFFIIGAQKSGTTALFSYMIRSSNVLPSKTKEIHFFDRFDDMLMDWPQEVTKYLESFHRNKDPASLVTVDTTPSYVLSARTGRVLRSWLPQSKLVLVLREPVDRAFSEYQMVHRRVEFWDNLAVVANVDARGVRDCLLAVIKRKTAKSKTALEEVRFCLRRLDPTLPFADRFIRFVRSNAKDADALNRLLPEKAQNVSWNWSLRPSSLSTSFAMRVRAEMQELKDCSKKRDNRTACLPYSETSNIEAGAHLSRGMYANQIKGWLQSFPATQLHIVSHSKLLKDSVNAVSSVCRFLGIPLFVTRALPSEELDLTIQTKFPLFWKEGWVINATTPPETLSEALRVELRKFFRPYNEELARILVSTFGWSTEAAADPY